MGTVVALSTALVLYLSFEWGKGSRGFWTLDDFIEAPDPSERIKQIRNFDLG
jgi:hypothetical protein